MLSASFSRSLARRFLTLCVSLAASTAALLAQTPSAADGFDPNVDGNVYAMATQPDGKILIAGQFSAFRPNGTTDLFGTTRNNLARLNPDGTLDASFDPNVNGPVRALVIQPDGRIVIGGDFTALQPAGTAAPATRNRIARLNADGTLDASFTPGFIPGGTLNLAPQVFALALQADGSIVAGGSFLSVAGGFGFTAVVPRRNLARFSSNGALQAYDPNPNSVVLALALHAGGKLLVGGGFTTFQPNGTAATTTRNRIALLNTDGTVDANFDPNANNGVTSIAVQRDGRILLGGYFTTVQPVGNGGATSRNHIVRLYADGTLDNDFQANAGGNVTTVAVAPDGAVLVGGPFTSVWGRGGTTISRGFLGRFLPDGTVDGVFSAGLNSEVAALAFQADGKIVVGGYFTRVTPTGAATPLVRNRLARLNANGSLDTNFEIEAGGRPLVSAVQADGKVILGGSFTTVGGATHNYLARLNVDGSADASYNPVFNSRVLAVAVQSDGKAIVGGTFTTANGQARNHLARLNTDGTLDPDFNPNVDGLVGAIAVQSDGKIVVGGSFTLLQPTGATTSTFRNSVARLLATGQLDTTFDPSPSNTVAAIIVQSDGKILLGGAFTSLVPNGGNGVGASSLARVNADGTIDSTFAPNFNAQVTSLALQGDGKIVVGGLFTQVGGTRATAPSNRNRIARLNADGTVDAAYDPNANGNVLTLALQSDGKLLVGGTFNTFTPNGAADWTTRKYAARLNLDGALDPTWNLDINEIGGNRVDSLRVLSDGRALIGGVFTSFQPLGASTRVVRKNFARLTATGGLDATFDFGSGGATGALVNALAVQPDGKIVAAGVFSDLGGAKTANIARFNPEGSADASFGTTLSADGPVNAVAVRPTAAAVAAQLNGLAWLNANGSLRTAFAPGADVRLSGVVAAVAFQSDGKVLVGGSFANLTSASNGNLLRFAANGALDTGFTPTVNGQVSGIVVQSDGKIVIVGAFTLVNNAVRNRIARLNADGTLDLTYDPNAAAPINAIVLQADGKIVIGGAFTTLTPNGATVAVNRAYLARLETTGLADTVYNPTLNSNVNGLALQADGKVIAGGAFTAAQPNGTTTAIARNFVARFNADGTLDTAFDPNTNNAVNAIVVQANGDVVLGGAFTSLQPTGETTGAAFSNLARVRGTNAAIDRGFNPNPNAVVNALALQPDGAILAGGNFTTLQPGGAGTAVTRNHVARINSDGSLDIAFNPDVTGEVFTVVARSDGSVLVTGTFAGVQGNGLLLVGGAFNNIGGLAAKNLALLNDDGSINSGFLPGPNGAVNSILALPDGRFLVSGAFTTIAGAARNGIARFNADGSLDSAFNPINSYGVLALQPDGKIVVSGAAGLMRLNADGSVDATFTASGASTFGVPLAAVQSDGRIIYVVNGTALSLGAQSLRRVDANGVVDTSFQPPILPFTGIRALAVQADGRILLATVSTTSPATGGFSGRPYVTRLNADGTVDTTFDPQPNGRVGALALQSDGRLMIGGSFTTVGGLPRVALARLSVTSAAANTLAVTADRASVMWLRSGTTGEIASARFEFSTDGRVWTNLGNGVRTASGWQVSGLQLPATITFYVRARGIAPSSSGTASGVYESVREFNFASAGFNAPAAGSFPAEASSAQFFYVDPFTGQAVGVFPNASGHSVVVAGVPSTAKILGAATEVGTNIVHSNGNVYDQVLLQGGVTTVTADAGQIVRLSYVGLNNDIVQVEFSGAGSLSLVLDNASGPAVAQNYNQPDVSYVRGHAGLIINGADQTSNISVFSVGRLTAVNQGLFRSDVTYAGVADLAYLAITSTDGKFGSVRTADASYYATSGLTGIYAPGVQFTGPVYVGDISGFDRAVATLVLGFANEVSVTGGDLFQANGQPVTVSGFTQLKFVNGTTSNGALLPAQANKAALEDHDADVTTRVVVNPPTP